MSQDKLGHTEMKRGTQIAYVPRHANGDLKHPDVEFGFITSLRENCAFCRYWIKGKPGVLRTTSNSELTPFLCLIKHKSVSQEEIEEILDGFNSRQ
jgi:hypothetical protein